MEVVLDTNVVVSAAISPNGPPAAILRAWRAAAFVWISSEPLLDELGRTLRSPRLRRYIAWDERANEEFLATVEQSVRIVHPARQLSVIKSDPSDNRLLEAAATAGADYIVSGDSDLLELGSYGGIEVVTPTRFASMLAEAAAD